jgi:hypothetical protein
MGEKKSWSKVSMRPEAINDCAGEAQQQFNWPDRASESRQIVKYGHESRGTWNQESLCWRGPAAV